MGSLEKGGFFWDSRRAARAEVYEREDKRSQAAEERWPAAEDRRLDKPDKQRGRIDEQR